MNKKEYGIVHIFVNNIMYSVFAKQEKFLWQNIRYW